MGVETTERAFEFWDFYDGDLFVSLKRSNAGDYDGVRMDIEKGEDTLFPETVPFAISRNELLGYQYAADERFLRKVSATLSSALQAVLQRDELKEESIPNFHRLYLIIRIIRDPAPAEPSQDIIDTTNSLLWVYARGKTRRDRLTDVLRKLVKGRDDNFAAFCDAVLEYLEKKILSTWQAAHLLYGVEPRYDMPFPALSGIVLEVLTKCELPLEKACQFLEYLLPDEENYQEMQASGRIAAVNTERDVLLQALAMSPTGSGITDQFVRIINNHNNEDLFFIIEAIKALGVHNGKAAIEYLVACLDRGDMARYWDDIEGALQRLCSGSELIPKAVFGIDFENLSESELAEMEGKEDHELRIEYDYWQGKLKTLPGTPEAWFQHDAGSVFWEKRLRCALQARDLKVPGAMLEELQRDEVATVRLAAGGPEVLEL